MKAILLSFFTCLLTLSFGWADEPVRRIALTYDDAPRGDGQVFTGAERATVLIAALEAVEAGPVAFFVTTDGFETEEDGKERIARYAAAGHLIAHHTHSHPWAHRMTADDYLADIDKGIAHLAGFENWRPWFRYPYLDEGRSVEKRDEIVTGLNELGLINGYVTVDNYDWHIERRLQTAMKEGRGVDYDKLGALYTEMLIEATEFFDEAAQETLGRSPVHVLLLHENDLAALYADDLVRAFRKAGWEIVSPDVAYADPIATMIPETLFTMQGRVAALASEEGMSPRHFNFWASDEARIDAEIAARGIFEESEE